MFIMTETIIINNELTRAKIAEKRKLLEENVTKVRLEVTNCFKDLSYLIKTREKQLLRQIEAIHNQQLSIVQSNFDLLCSTPSLTINLNNFIELKDLINNFGEINLPNNDGMIVKNIEPYKVQDYEDDHFSFDKTLKNNEEKTQELMININKCTVDIENIQFNSTQNDLTLKNNQSNDEVDGPGIYKADNHHDDSNLNVSSNENHVNISNYSSEIATPKLNDSKVDDSHSESKVTKMINISQTNETSTNQLNNSYNHSNNNTNNNNNYNNLRQTDNDSKVIKQWLQQILIDAEIEPPIHEPQFVEISKACY